MIVDDSAAKTTQVSDLFGRTLFTRYTFSQSEMNYNTARLYWALMVSQQKATQAASSIKFHNNGKTFLLGSLHVKYIALWAKWTPSLIHIIILE